MNGETEGAIYDFVFMGYYWHPRRYQSDHLYQLSFQSE
jgi:hypothetical protein